MFLKNKCFFSGWCCLDARESGCPYSIGEDIWCFNIRLAWGTSIQHSKLLCIPASWSVDDLWPNPGPCQESNHPFSWKHRCAGLCFQNWDDIKPDSTIYSLPGVWIYWHVGPDDVWQPRFNQHAGGRLHITFQLTRWLQEQKWKRWRGRSESSESSNATLLPLCYWGQGRSATKSWLMISLPWVCLKQFENVM